MSVLPSSQTHSHTITPPPGITSMAAIGSQLEAYDDHIIDVMGDRFVTMAISWTETGTHLDELGGEEGDEGDGGGEKAVATGLKVLQSEYTTLHHHTVQHGKGSSTVSSNGGEGGSGGHGPSKHATGALQEPLGQLLHALLHVHKLQPTLELYSTRLLDNINLIVRTCLLEYINPNPLDAYTSADTTENTANAGPFAQRVRNMTNENFLSCLSMCFEHLSQALSRASSIHIFISDSLYDEDMCADDDTLMEDWGEDGVAVGVGSSVETSRGGASTGKQSGDGDMYRCTQRMEGVDDRGQQDEQQRRKRSVSVEEEGVRARREREKQWALEFSATVLVNACELAQKAINQLLLLRKETNARLHIDQMKFLWEVSLHFIAGIERFEAAPGEKISTVALRNGLLAQTKKFLEHTHEAYKGRLVNTLDSEKWVQCDVSRDRQVALDRLTSGRLFLRSSSSASGNGAGNSSSGAAHGRGRGGAEPLDHSNGANTVLTRDTSQGPTSMTPTAGPVSKKSAEPASIAVDGVEFKVVWSALLLVEIILTYLDVAVQFPLITKEVISKTVEVTSLFDSRSKQLVLGAQAIQSAARLKFIAAKHLGIMAQCLTFFQAVLPHVRAALMAQLPPEHHLMLVELDRVSKGIIEHHAKVLSKFVSIVGDFVDSSSLKLRQIDWDRLSTQCEYFEEVLKNVSALHKVLGNYLPPDQMLDVFSRIFALLNRKIPEHFEEIFPSTQTGKQRITDEIVHLVTSLSRLKHIDASLLTVEETFRKKFEQR